MPKQITLGQAYQIDLESGFANALIMRAGVDVETARQVATSTLEGEAVKTLKAYGLDPNMMVTLEDDGKCPQVKVIIDAFPPPPGQKQVALAIDPETQRIVTVDDTPEREHTKAAVRASHLGL